MMKHYEKARICRESIGLSQEDVAKQVHVSQPAYFRFENGQIENPKYIKLLAKLFNTTPEWLEYNIGTPPPYWPASAKITSWNDLKSIKPEDIKEPFTLTIQDHTMEDHTQPRRSFYEGQKIEIHPNEPLKNGVFVVAILKDSNEPVFRRYSDVAGIKQLETFSDKYPAIPLEKVDRIIGVVKMRFEEVSV